MTLQDIMNQLAKDWPFDEKNYPALANCGPPNSPSFKRFAVSKSHAVLATAVEKSDHGAGLFEKNTNLIELQQQMHKAAYNMVKSSLRLAQVLGLTAEDIMVV